MPDFSNRGVPFISLPLNVERPRHLAALLAFPEKGFFLSRRVTVSGIGVAQEL